MAHYLPLLKAAWSKTKIHKAVVYCTLRTVASVDSFAYLAPGHMVSWNVLNNPGLAGMMALDFDGILCEDWRGPSDDEGPNYQRFLEQARPLQWPSRVPVPAIISARLEKYRPQSEAWLVRHGIAYKRLILWRGGASERWRDNAAAKWKADEYKQTEEARIYIESDPQQARTIFSESKKRVVCPALGGTVR